MKKITILSFLFLFIFLCTDSRVKAEETIAIPKSSGGNLMHRGTSTPVMMNKDYTYKIEEFRGTWVATVENINIIKQNGSSEEAISNYKNLITNILDTTKSYGLNAVVWQIRPLNDAFYYSEINPISRYFVSGVKSEGNDPGWDMLDYLVKETHKRGMEFHAWLNPYRASLNISWSGTGTARFTNYLNSLDDKNFAKKNPDLLVRGGERILLNPGEPKVREHIYDTIKEIVENYDVDAIHFDDYFYNGVAHTEDAATYTKYPVSGITNKNDWRREQVNILIKTIKELLADFNKNNNRAVQLGISPTGIWDNGGSLGSNTAGQAHYSDLFCDSRKWVLNNWIDYITPQTYWGLEHTTGGFAELTKWWSSVVKGTKVNLYMGHGPYMEDTNREDWSNKPKEFEHRLKNMDMYQEIKGSCIYNYDNVKNSQNASTGVSTKTGMALLRDDYFKKFIPQTKTQMFEIKISNAITASLVEVGPKNFIVWEKPDDVRGMVVYRVNRGVTLNVNNPNHIFTYSASNEIEVSDTALYDYYYSLRSRSGHLTNSIKLSDKEVDAEFVKNLINNLGEITLNSRENIEFARECYDNLPQAEKNKINSATLNVLETAEARYVDLVKNDETIKNVRNLINSIGRVEFSSVGRNKIANARKAYNDLTAAQKASITVTELQTLIEAEKKFLELQVDFYIENFILGKFAK